jgi:hypothetical protein
MAQVSWQISKIPVLWLGVRPGLRLGDIQENNYALTAH